MVKSIVPEHQIFVAARKSLVKIYGINVTAGKYTLSAIAAADYLRSAKRPSQKRGSHV